MADERVEAERVALFPLQTVLFPGGLLPLRIFEPRYQRMVSECLRGERPFGVVSIIEGSEVGAAARTARCGTLARIVDWERLQDGLLGLLCEGERTFDVREVEVEHDKLLRASIAPRPLPEPGAVPADLAWTEALLDEVLQRLGPPFDRLRRSDPTADHVAARLIELLPLPLVDKQDLFETAGAVERLRRLSRLIDPAKTGH